MQGSRAEIDRAWQILPIKQREHTLNSSKSESEPILDENPGSLLSETQQQVINTTTWRASDTLTVKNIVSYGEFRERASWSLNGDNFRVSNPAPDLTAVGFPPLTPGTPFQYVTLNPTPGQDNASESTITEELQLQGQSKDGRLNYVVGGYLEFSRPVGWNAGRTSVFLDCESPSQLECGNNPFFIGYISDSRTRYSFDNHGVFGQATYNFTDQLALTAGLRYTFDKIEAVGETTQIRYLPLTFGPGARNCEDTVRFNTPDPDEPGAILPLPVSSPTQCHNVIKTSSKKPTWLINLDYKPTADTLLYAKWARGYRQGGINLTGIGAESWSPEQLDTYEVGAKISFSGPIRGYFNVAGFYNDFRNQQINASLVAKPGQGSGASTIVNAGTSEIKGVEVEASITPLDGLRIDAGYAYLNGRVKEMVVPTLPAESPYAEIEVSTSAGDRLTLTPRNRLTITGTYTLPLDERFGELSIGATFTHTDSVLSDTRASMPAMLRILPATDLLNLNLNWDGAMGSPFSLSLFATNVTNEIYPVAAGSGYTSSGIGTWVMAQPRMYGLRLRYTLGQ